MRLDNSEHFSHPWRIQEITKDFELEDVWRLPVQGNADEFPELLEVMASLDPARSDSTATKALWVIRDLLGKWFGLGRTSAEAQPKVRVALPIPGTAETSLIERLPEDLEDTVDDPRFEVSGPFEPLFFTDDEFAAEISNQTVHGVLHLAWVDQGDGSFVGEMAVYVKPRGRLGQGYMELIKPFRHWIVYPAMMRQIETAWVQSRASI